MPLCEHPNPEECPQHGKAARERAEARVRLMTPREHALRAGELASAIQPASERFSETLADPMRHTEAIATGAIKAHNAAIEYTIRVAELHARVADVLLRTADGFDRVDGP